MDKACNTCKFYRYSCANYDMDCDECEEHGYPCFNCAEYIYGGRHGPGFYKGVRYMFITTPPDISQIMTNYVQWNGVTYSVEIPSDHPKNNKTNKNHINEPHRCSTP